ncbi:peptidase M24, structural domain-containing protein [Xylariaceae sp. FL1019]|nr:peptidase M24, structural domain-containing protein [Xylariaceae sp. FL1019]
MRGRSIWGRLEGKSATALLSSSWTGPSSRFLSRQLNNYSKVNHLRRYTQHTSHRPAAKSFVSLPISIQASRATPPSLLFRLSSPTPPRCFASTGTTATTASHPISTMATLADIDVDDVLTGKYPAKLHAKRVADYIRSKSPDAKGVLFLQGTADALLEDSDEPVPFRQRRQFMYLTGVDMPDCAFIYDIDTDKSTLFIPPINAEHVMWAGLPLSTEEALAQFDVDDVQYSNELNPHLAHIGAAKPDATVFAIADRVANNVTFLEFGNKDFTLLAEAIDECRVVKDDYEIALIRKANIISGAAHKAVLQHVHTAENEHELEAVFLGDCGRHGAKKQAYPSIVASGRAAATLHYVHNDKQIKGKDLLLLDAGAEWRTYASDITRTFPISGHFSKKSRAIYDIVLKMQEDCIAMLKDGVLWDDVHLLSHKVLIDGLLSLGILKGDPKEILESRVSAAFLPHGLGHYLGMDTHDTGGHPNYSDEDQLFRFLRVRRNLPAGSVITVEPGIYFCEYIIRPYLTDPIRGKYIDEGVLNEYWDVGGVRIEDNLLITEDGSVNLTDAIKDPEEMERIIQGA